MKLLAFNYEVCPVEFISSCNTMTLLQLFSHTLRQKGWEASSKEAGETSGYSPYLSPSLCHGDLGSLTSSHTAPSHLYKLW